MNIGTMEATSKCLRSSATWEMQGVDRKNNLIRGYRVAQTGIFKDRRGEFDLSSLRDVVRLMKANAVGTKVHLGHATLSDDGVGKILGRAKNPRLDGEIVRADLHINEASFRSPAGDIGHYVMDLAESDPGQLSSSLVLEADEVERLDDKGRQIKGEDGQPIPPLWKPTKIHASDVVDTGAAVDDFLSVDDLPDNLQRQGAKMLNQIFGGVSREVIEARCGAWLKRYLDMRFRPTETSGGNIEHYRAIVNAQREIISTVTTR